MRIVIILPGKSHDKYEIVQEESHSLAKIKL